MSKRSRPRWRFRRQRRREHDRRRVPFLPEPLTKSLRDRALARGDGTVDHDQRLHRCLDCVSRCAAQAEADGFEEPASGTSA